MQRPRVTSSTSVSNTSTRPPTYESRKIRPRGSHHHGPGVPHPPLERPNSRPLTRRPEAAARTAAVPSLPPECACVLGGLPHRAVGAPRRSGVSTVQPKPRVCAARSHPLPLTPCRPRLHGDVADPPAGPPRPAASPWLSAPRPSALPRGAGRRGSPPPPWPPRRGCSASAGACDRDSDSVRRTPAPFPSGFPDQEITPQDTRYGKWPL